MVAMPPNTRVQRTRSSASPPHSPLTSEVSNLPLAGRLMKMQLYQVDDFDALFISPAVDDWGPLQESGTGGH